MLLNKIKKSFFVFLLIIFSAGVFAQSATSDLTKRYLDRAVEQYEANKIEDAYKTVSAVLKLNETSGIPANVSLLAAQIYSKKLDIILSTKDYSSFDEVVSRIETYPSIAAPEIQRKVKAVYAQQETEIQKAKAEAEKAERTEQFNMYQKQLDNLGEAQSSFMKTLSENQDTVMKAMNENQEKVAETMEKIAKTSEESAKSNHIVLVAVLIICGILVLVFVIVIICVRLAAKASVRQSMQFEETLKLVAGMQQTNNQLLLGSVTDLQGISSLRSAGSSRWGVDALPAPEMNQEEKEELKKLAIACEELGSKIDAVTKRKNNSKNVSELVYKLALHLGLNQNTAMAYFCAAMIYDAGFLGVPEEILEADTITDEQREKMRNHVNSYEEFFDFVPKTYRQIFEDAAKFHHENEDGSGYPNAIKSEEIPQIAKLIHVVESYISLVSRRNYKEIKDKESAIEELLSKPQIYDEIVVKALDSIV